MDWNHNTILVVRDRDDLLPQSLSYDAPHNLPIRATHPKCGDVDWVRS